MNPTALLFLILAIAAEVAGTAGLKASEGFGRLGPSALAVIGYAWPSILGPEPQIHPAGGRLCHMVGAGNGGLGPVGVANLEGDFWAGSRRGYSPDRGGLVVLNLAPGH